MVDVTSEVGRLTRVLVHEPGMEVDHMVPSSMDELLFDDVLFGDRAREEHALFRRVLQLTGVETDEAADLLAAALEDPEARGWILDLLPAEISPSVRERFAAAAPADLAEMITAGVRRGTALGIEDEELFEIPPLPNWCFQRDPQIVLAGGVVFGAMASPARHREALLARAIFRWHPALRSVPVIHDPLDRPAGQPLLAEEPRLALEGGDVMVFSRDVVAVGHSERTTRPAIGGLARALAGCERGPRWLLVVELPRRRAYMHLDTVITPVDRDAALVYPSVILSDGPESARVYEIDLHAPEPAPHPAGGLLDALRRRGVDLEPIPCGGTDPLRQQREQWTDGANALALAPGVIVLYERNVGTTEELSRRGFRVVAAEDLVLGRDEVDVDEPGRAVIVLPSHELSRARGGPHCLSHPLTRDPV
jgi:arginine deiminase